MPKRKLSDMDSKQDAPNFERIQEGEMFLGTTAVDHGGKLVAHADINVPADQSPAVFMTHVMELGARLVEKIWGPDGVNEAYEQLCSALAEIDEEDKDAPI